MLCLHLALGPLPLLWLRCSCLLSFLRADAIIAVLPLAVLPCCLLLLQQLSFPLAAALFELPTNTAVAGAAHPLLSGGRVAAPERPLAAPRAGGAALQAAPLRHVSAHLIHPPGLRWAPLQHAVGRQLAAVPVCILATCVAKLFAAGRVAPPVARRVRAAAVGAAPLLATRVPVRCRPI